MKKLFTIIAILFTINCSAQDTSYVLGREKFYRVIRQEVNLTDSNSVLKYTKLKLENRRKVKRINRIAFAVFIGVTSFFWIK